MQNSKLYESKMREKRFKPTLYYKKPIQKFKKHNFYQKKFIYKLYAINFHFLEKKFLVFIR